MIDPRLETAAMLPHDSTSGVEIGSTDGLRPRALVMDDDPLFRTLLVAMLKQNYQVTAAADGADGFYKALEAPPDVAVVDIQMPGWDGLRTIKAFREHRSLSGVPLLVLSSDTTEGTVLAAIGAGADDYLIKSSFNREELLQKLQYLRDRCVIGQLPARAMRTDAGTTSAVQQSHRSPAAGRPSDTIATLERPLADRVQEAIDAWE